MKRMITLAAGVMLVSSLASAESFQSAFESNRAMYGKNHVFEWNGSRYSTQHEEEVEAAVKATRANALDLIAKAKAKNDMAAELGFEWKLTRDIIADAEQAVEAGEYRKALDLAAQAKYHARMGIAQHAHAEKHWHLSVPQ